MKSGLTPPTLEGDVTRVLLAGGSYAPADATAMGHALLSLASFATSPPQPANLPAWRVTMAPVLSLLTRVAATLPKEVIVGKDGPYLERYDVGTTSDNGAVRLHRFLRSDEDAELHSHPWAADSLVLLGSMREERRHGTHDTGYEVQIRELHAGDCYAISADTYHRVDLITPEVWTLFCTGPHVRSWAFWNRKTGHHTPWREFIEAKGLWPEADPLTPHDKAMRCITLADLLSPDDPEAARLRAHADTLLRGAP